MAIVRGRNFRENFDRNQDFVVVRPFKFNGKGYLPGQSLNKDLFVLRRLRQLYDQRVINQVPLVVEPNGFVYGTSEEGLPAVKQGVEQASPTNGPEKVLEEASEGGTQVQPRGRVPRRRPARRA